MSRQVFFGRDRDSVALADQILANRLVIVYAKSGSGKTSLLNAGVAPRLRDARWVPLFVRVNDLQRGAKAGVLEGIRAEAERQKLEYVPGDTTSLWAFFKTAEFWRDDDLLTPVLIVDQFEELFTLQKFESRDEFLSELGSLLRGVAPSGKDGLPAGVSPGPPPIHVVLSLREDFLGLLEEASGQIPEIMDHRFRLAPLTTETARVTITGPAAISHSSLATQAFSLEPACVDAILNYLGRSASRRDTARSRQIEPFHLQMICQYIENVAALKQRTSGEEVRLSLVDIGGEQALADTLKTFYSKAIGSLPKRHRRAAGRMCEQFLISAEGRRLSVDERELWRAASLPSDVLRLLVEQRLLRTDRRSDRTYYELGHDALVQPVLATRRRQAFLLYRIAIFAGSAITLPAAVLLVFMVGFVISAGIDGLLYALLLGPVGTGIGFIGIYCLRSGSRRRARFSVQGTASDGDSPPTRLPWYKLACGWVMLVIGPTLCLFFGIFLLIAIGNAVVNVVVSLSGALAGHDFWKMLSSGGIAAFGWFLFQRGDQLLWPDEFSTPSASWQGQVLLRQRLQLRGMSKFTLGGLALTVACLGTAGLFSSSSITLRGVAAYLHFAGLYAGAIEACSTGRFPSDFFWPQIWLGVFTFVAFIMSAVWMSGGAVDIWKDIQFRANVLKTKSFLPLLAVGAAIAVLTPINLYVWSKATVARVSSEGWVSGPNYILHTTDGGGTWAHLGPTPEPLDSLAFTSRLSGWATGDQGLWHTEDGGIHWNLKVPSEKEKGHPLLVAFASPQSGLALWNGHSDLFRTTDGGNTWSAVQPSPLRGSSSPRSVAFLDPQMGWAVTVEILHSADGGSTWSKQYNGTKQLNAVSIANAQSVWAVGEAGTILHTADAGSTWEIQSKNIHSPSSFIGSLADIASLSPSAAIAVGFGALGSGYLLHTEDGGKTWKDLPDVFASSLSRVIFTSPTTGWTLSEGGVIMHTEDGGHTWTFEYAAREKLNSMTFLKP